MTTATAVPATFIASKSLPFAPPEPIAVGRHVLFIEYGHIRDGLIETIFQDHMTTWPLLSILLIRTGGRSTISKIHVAHQSMRKHGKGYWCLPSEEVQS